MAGITRIVITDSTKGRGAYRFEEAKKRQPAADEIYRTTFLQRGMELLPGYEEIECSSEDIPAAYDRLLGIDVLFTFTNGMMATLQEKFLFKNFNTITIEYYNNPIDKTPGDWFHLKANYYFVGYDRINVFAFQDWAMLDWLAIQRGTMAGEIKWRILSNKYDGAKANFKYVNISNIPKRCIVAQDWGGVRFVNPDISPIIDQVKDRANTMITLPLLAALDYLHAHNLTIARLWPEQPDNAPPQTHITTKPVSEK